MIFTFIKHLIRWLLYLPPLLAFILFVPATYRRYWAGWALLPCGADSYGTIYTGYCCEEKTLLWMMSVLSLNWGSYPPEWNLKRRALLESEWKGFRSEWLERHNFKKECSWVSTRHAGSVFHFWAY